MKNVRLKRSFKNAPEQLRRNLCTISKRDGAVGTRWSAPFTFVKKRARAAKTQSMHDFNF